MYTLNYTNHLHAFTYLIVVPINYPTYLPTQRPTFTK